MDDLNLIAKHNRKKLDDDEILEVIQRELDSCQLDDTDDLYQNWEKAYAYYKGEAPGPDPGLTSEVVSTDVSDVIEWVLPAILKPLVESPDVVRFDPVNPEDEAQADLESDYVHHTFMKKCNGFGKLYCHIKDALMLKVGVFATYWDEGVENRLEPYKNLTDIELADLLTPSEEGVEVELVEIKTREEPIIDPMTGEPVQPMPQPDPMAQPMPPPDPMSQPDPMAPPQPQPQPQPTTQTFYDVKVRRYWRRGRPVVENVVPEHFRVRMDHDSIDLTSARFCSYSLPKTRSQLLALGYDREKVSEIRSAGVSDVDADEVRRAREDVERNANEISARENTSGLFWADEVIIHRVFITLDADGDGHEEKIHAVLGGDDGEILLEWYEVPENPFSASTPFIAAHKFYGQSLFDKIRHIADHKTKALRMLEDNMDLANNPRKKVARGQANLGDLMLNEVGGIWRMDTLGAVEVMPPENIQQHGYQLLDYLDKMRTERSGIDPNAQSISKIMPEESMNSAVERVLSAKEELVGLLVRVFAETGVKDMFLKLRGLMMRNLPRRELVKLRNKWVEVDPNNWVERTATTVVVGLGTGDRLKKTQGLSMLYQMQQQLMQGGMLGHLVTPERMHHTLSELVRVQGLGDPGDYLIDPALMMPGNPEINSPRGVEAQKAMQIAQQQAQQQQQADQAAQQAQMQEKQQLLDLQMQIAQQQQETKRMEAMLRQQTADKDRAAEMQQFMREMRLEWAKLMQTGSVESVRAQAKVGADLVKEGLKESAARRAEAMSERERNDNESS